MSVLKGYVQNASGVAQSGVSVTIKNKAGATATIYSERTLTTTTANPLTTDSNGYFECFVPAGEYTAQFGAPISRNEECVAAPGEAIAMTVTLSADQTIATATVTKLALDTRVDNQGNTTTDWDTATDYEFTAPFGGLFTFDVQVQWVGLADADVADLYLYKDGAEFQKATKRAPGAGVVYQSMNATLWLDAGDTIDARVQQASGGNEDIEADGSLLRVSFRR